MRKYNVIGVVLAALAMPAFGYAQNGTWAVDADGDWGTATNWVGNVIADGADNTASFTTNITANRVVNLDSARTIGNITVTDLPTDSHNLTISGANTLSLDVTAGAPVINVTQTTATARSLTFSSVIAGNDGLTKVGNGVLLLNGAAVNTFTGGLNVNGGTLNANFANLATPTDLINSGNALNIGGGVLLVTGNSVGATSQTLGNLTVNSGGGGLRINPNGGTSTTVALGSLTATASGGSLVVGRAIGAGAGTATITTTTNTDVTGIYGGRVVFANGTAGTGYDWATNAGGGGPYTLAAYSGYSAINTGGGSDANNSRVNAAGTTTLTANLTTNSLKFEQTAAGQVLDLGTNTLTLSSGGLLVTGTALAGTNAPRITNGNLTAGADSNYNLVIHQYNLNDQTAGNIDRNVNILARITDNGGNPVTLVKSGTGTLILAGANTFTGGVVVNDGGTLGFRTTNLVLNNNSLTFNANTIVKPGVSNIVTNGGITINNGSVVDFRNNTQTFTVNGPVTGAGAGITLGQEGGGATRLNFNSTANTFNGPIEFRVTPNAGQDGQLTVNSLADAAYLGSGDIRFGVAGTGTNQHILIYGTGAVAPLTLNNRRIELAGSHASPVLVNNSSQAFTINTDVLSSGTGTKTLTMRGTGTGISTIAGDITNGTITTLNITKSESGTWVLSGDNTYNGGTTVSAGQLTISGNNAGRTGLNTVNGTGRLNLAHTNALGTGTLQFGGAGTASLDNTSGGALTLATNNPGNWLADFTFVGSNDLNLGTGAVSMGGGRNITVTASKLTVGGGISGAFTLTKSGAGILELGGANGYTGATTVSAGKLLVNGSTAAASAVTVNNASVIGGIGTINGSVTLNNTSTLSPGISPGQLTVGSLALGGTTNTLMELGGTTLGSQYDNLNVILNGGLTYGGNLDVVNFGAYNMDLISASYDLFAFGGTTVPSGNFATVTVNSIALTQSGSQWTGVNELASYVFDQATGDLSITVVPEPSSLVLFVLGMLGLWRLRRGK